jgi:hypothetical protein
VQLTPDMVDPYDLSNFPPAQYPYAFEIFGNDGSTTCGRTFVGSDHYPIFVGLHHCQRAWRRHPPRPFWQRGFWNEHLFPNQTVFFHHQYRVDPVENWVAVCKD